MDRHPAPSKALAVTASVTAVVSAGLCIWLLIVPAFARESSLKPLDKFLLAAFIVATITYLCGATLIVLRRSLGRKLLIVGSTVTLIAIAIIGWTHIIEAKAHRDASWLLPLFLFLDFICAIFPAAVLILATRPSVRLWLTTPSPRKPTGPPTEHA